jgi:hypothetical protein
MKIYSTEDRRYSNISRAWNNTALRWDLDKIPKKYRVTRFNDCDLWLFEGSTLVFRASAVITTNGNSTVTVSKCS